MRKRKIADGDGGESTGSEMEVDGEEKMEHTEESETEGDSHGMNEEDEIPATPARKDNPFLDSFYGLSSEDPRERSQAAQTMLHQCLLGPNANTKDASYALRRLFNGLCSGRAAARQGNASALASFLKVAFHLEKIENIQIEMDGENPPTKTALSFVRERLLVATDPSQIAGKKKGSEERDYQFGRLFGILGVARSNVLLPNDGSDLSEITGVVSNLLSDLSELFWLKKWMREPAAHGIATLLKSFYEGHSKAACTKVLDHVVSQVVIPKILTKGTTGKGIESAHKTLLESFCAEQIGIGCFIQSHADSHNHELPFPLNTATLSVETMPIVSMALAETSNVLQPRTHFVWDAMFCYLFETSSTSKSKLHPSQKILRTSCPVGDDSALDLIEAVLESVVMNRLLGIDNQKTGSASKATHERRSLAMCIVKNLSGVSFMSSLSGPTRLFLDQDAMENVVLAPGIIRRLFLDVICAGKQNKQQSSHLLKPLALEVLSAISTAVVDETTLVESTGERRLSCARALLKADVRFDARTKTSIIGDLLGLTDTISQGTKDELCSFWNQYLSFLQSQFLIKCEQINESTAEATGYVELMYSAAKQIIRLESETKDGAPALKEYKDFSILKILGFFMASAFFDCSNLEGAAEKGTKKKKGRKKPTTRPQILESASLVKGAPIPYAVRSMISARFFSLVSDFVHNETHRKIESNKGKIEKDSIALTILSSICNSWKTLESFGAKTHASTMEADENDGTTDGICVILEELNKSVAALTALLKKDPDSSVIEAKKRCCTGIAVLAHALYLHRLKCGNDGDVENDNPDADDEDDEEEICNALEGLKDVTEDFLGDSTNDTNPLLGLTELAANILSSPLGSGEIGRCASPKLVREAVKFAWLGGLRLSSALSSEDRTLLDNEVIDTLIDAIGASTTSSNEDDMDDDEGEDSETDSEDKDEENDSDDNNIFAKATNLLDDSDQMEVHSSKGETAEDEASDVEVNDEKLQLMLEEDSDASMGSDVLEHHEGADAALAKLIKLKQDARKAGKLVRERIEISNQLRCTFLIELLFGRPDAWNRLFRGDVVLRIVTPMLKHRKKMEKSLDKSNGNRSKSGYSEKKALVDKLTSLVKMRICKLKLSSMPIEALIDVESASKVVDAIVDELRRATSKEHASCCCSAIVFVLRSVPTGTDSVSPGSALGAAVQEWSTKRTTRLESFIFDYLIENVPM